MVREEVREHRYQAIPIPPLIGEPVYHRNAPRRTAAPQVATVNREDNNNHDNNDADADDWATRCLLPGVVMLPSVVIPREEGMDDDSRLGRRSRRLQRYGRNARSCLSKRGLTMVATFLAWNLLMEDWWWPLATWNREEDLYPTKILTDFSNVASAQDLNLDMMVSLCQPDRKPECQCDDPLQPKERLERADWGQVHEAHVATVQQAVKKGEQIDVLFLGDSITEGWGGKSMGVLAPLRLGKVPKVFASLFSKDDGGRYQGVALGISGDRSPNLLWRLQNGELPAKLNPSVIWLLIGTNDLGNGRCSAEATAIGIVRVVEELLLRKPAATIVINGLLPRTFHARGYVHRKQPHWFGWWQSTVPSQMYEDIQAINEELKRYATHRDKVEYFETNVFWEKPSARLEKLRINRSLMPDYLHPNEKGYRKWGTEIVAKLDQILSPTR